MQEHNITLFIVMEDEILHTAEHPFCSDPHCPCRRDEGLIRQYISGPYVAGLLSDEDAVRIFEGQPLVSRHFTFHINLHLEDESC